MSHPAYKPPLRFVLKLRLQKGRRICGTLRYLISMLPGCSFTRVSSRPARRRRKLHRAGKRTDLPSFRSVRPLQCANFALQAKNATNKATDGCVQNFQSRCGAWSTSELLQGELKNLPWWAVTRRTSKTTSKLGGGRLLGTVKLNSWQIYTITKIKYCSNMKSGCHSGNDTEQLNMQKNLF